VWVGSSPDGKVRLVRPRARQLRGSDHSLGTEGALHPFFSPDGHSLGFLTNDKLKTYSFVTATTTTICDVAVGVTGTWTADDQVFFAAQEGRRLFRVNVRGGAPVMVADARIGYRYGRVTPDGASALVTYRQAGIGADFAQVRLVNLATNEVKTLTTDGYDARLTRTGNLVFGRSGRVFAARFDSKQQTVADPVPIASDVRMHALYPHLQLAVSDNALAYVPGGDVAVASLGWVSRQGQTEFLPMEPRVYGSFDLSTDGRRLAIQVGDTNDFILIYDMTRGSSRRLPATDSAGWPKWSETARCWLTRALQRGSRTASWCSEWIRIVRLCRSPSRRLGSRRAHGARTAAGSRITSSRPIASRRCPSRSMAPRRRLPKS
jgi:hypothetical protein